MLNFSCNTCRARKVRCSGGTPCALCAQSGSACLRSARKTRQGSQTDASTASEDVDEAGASSLASSMARQIEASTSRQIIVGLPLAVDAERNPPTIVIDHALLKEARQKMFFSLDAYNVLIATSFRWLILPEIHGCIDIDTVVSYARQLYAMTDEESSHLASQVQPLTVDQVILVMLTLSTTLRAILLSGQSSEVLGSAMTFMPLTMQSFDLENCQRNLHALALDWLRAEMRVVDTQSATLEAIQSALLALSGSGYDTSLSEALMDRAIRWALRLSMHQLTRSTTNARREEVIVRTWWSLVTRSWLAAPKVWSYALHPNQIMTRTPFNVDFKDLENEDWDHTALASIKRVWTPATYLLATMALARTIRELVDVRVKRNLNDVEQRQPDEEFQSIAIRSFGQFVSSLPAIYRSSQEGAVIRSALPLAQGACIEKERWLLQQGIFHNFLDLHSIVFDRPLNNLTPPCVALAHQTLESYERYSQQNNGMRIASLWPAGTLLSAALIIATANNARDGVQRPNDLVKVSTIATQARMLVPASQRLARLDILLEQWQDALSPASTSAQSLADSEVALLRLQGVQSLYDPISPRETLPLRWPPSTSQDQRELLLPGGTASVDSEYGNGVAIWQSSDLIDTTITTPEIMTFATSNYPVANTETTPARLGDGGGQ